MTGIIWYPIMCQGQEISSRLGHDDLKDTTYVCCQEIYDIAWNTVKVMYQEWKKLYKDRNPHYDEFLRTWMLDYNFNDRITDTKYFRELPEFVKIVKLAHKKIFAFYKKHLNRSPTVPEIWAAFRQCDINPNFKYSWKLKAGTKEYLSKNYTNQKRKDHNLVKYCKNFKVGKCVFCGKKVMAYQIVGDGPDNLILCGAGKIKMHFGYGSTRDLDNGEGFIHDECSKILEKDIFKKRFNCNPCYWTNLFGRSATKKELKEI